MKYRTLDENRDHVFGGQPTPFLTNSPEAVAQAVLTRLLLWKGEWFLDTTAGTPYLQDIVGKFSQSRYDSAIKSRILGTQGVKEILKYQSTMNRDTRQLSVSVTLSTVYGTTTIETALT